MMKTTKKPMMKPMSEQRDAMAAKNTMKRANKLDAMDMSVKKYKKGGKCAPKGK